MTTYTDRDAAHAADLTHSQTSLRDLWRYVGRREGPWCSKRYGEKVTPEMLNAIADAAVATYITALADGYEPDTEADIDWRVAAQGFLDATEGRIS